MATGLTMKSRKHATPPKPKLAGNHWTDADFGPWLHGDYDICEQSDVVQAMLELAGMLADARREWALKAARDARNEQGATRINEYRPPRFLVDDRVVRRGYGARRE